MLNVKHNVITKTPMPDAIAPNLPYSGNRTKWALWVVMGIITLSLFTVFEYSNYPNSHDRFWDERYILVPHIVFGLIALLAGPFQFSSRFRQRNLALHRLLGKVYVVSVLIAAPLGFILTLKRPPLLEFAVGVQASLWFLTTIVAFVTARNRQINHHRQWMVRSYAVTFFFVSDRVPFECPFF